MQPGELLKYVDAHFVYRDGKEMKRKRAPQPVFIVTYGPPASGKSLMVERLMKRLEQDGLLLSSNNMVDINIDNVVGMLPGYKEEMAAMLKSDIIRDEKRWEATSSEIYLRYLNKGAENIRDLVLDRAFLQKMHIVWETTGNTVKRVLFEIQRAKSLGYIVHVIFPMIHEGQIFERLKSRASHEGRFPPLGYVGEAIKNAHKNFGLVAQSADAAYVYDNTGKPGEANLLFEWIHRFTGESGNGCSVTRRPNDANVTRRCMYPDGELEEIQCNVKGIQKFAKDLPLRQQQFLARKCSIQGLTPATSPEAEAILKRISPISIHHGRFSLVRKSANTKKSKVTKKSKLTRKKSQKSKTAKPRRAKIRSAGALINN